LNENQFDFLGNSMLSGASVEHGAIKQYFHQNSITINNHQK